MIVKVQRPIAPRDGEIMVYDRTRQVMEFRPCDDAAAVKLLGGELKVYANATREADGTLALQDRVDDPGDW